MIFQDLENMVFRAVHRHKNIETYWKLLILLVGSKHGVKIYNERIQLLKNILKNRQLGSEVEAITKEEEDTLGLKENKVFTVLKKSEVSYLENDSVAQEEKETIAKRKPLNMNQARNQQ